MDIRDTIALIDKWHSAPDLQTRVRARIELLDHLRNLHERLDKTVDQLADLLVNDFYAVLSPSEREGVIFKDKKQAVYAATGSLHPFTGAPTIATAFREVYADGRFGVLDGVDVVVVKKGETE